MTLRLPGMTQVLLRSSPSCGLLIRRDSKRNPSGLASAGPGGRSEVPTRHQLPHKPLYTSGGKILGFKLSSHSRLPCKTETRVSKHIHIIQSAGVCVRACVRECVCERKKSQGQVWEVIKARLRPGQSAVRAAAQCFVHLTYKQGRTSCSDIKVCVCLVRCSRNY